jgi:hypothetical protein
MLKYLNNNNMEHLLSTVVAIDRRTNISSITKVYKSKAPHKSFFFLYATF